MIKATLHRPGTERYMLHNWSRETDGNSVTVKAILFDYKKRLTLQII